MTAPLSEEQFDVFDIYESQYARDLEGRLIQIKAATQQDLYETVRAKIDGREGPVPKAVPATDDQGNLLRDAEGLLVPRLTTIYDAANVLFTSRPTEEQPIPINRNPIPVLCHQNHVKPVGVCRVCSVLTVRGGKAGARLVPACHHPVVDGMEVHTVDSGEKVHIPGEPEARPAGEHVRRLVKVLIEMLATYHLHGGQAEGNRKYHNELLALARDERFNIPVAESQGALQARTPFVHKQDWKKGREADSSSPVITFDANQCILCDRCVRACSDVKPFRIIGHTGFGNQARISFDLGKPMGESGCVSCGECAVACPTGAITFKGTIYQDRDPWQDHAVPRPQTVPAEELATHRLFAGVPYAYLKWNEGAVGRLVCEPGQVLCREGDYGSTAFVIEDGVLEIVVSPAPLTLPSPPSEGGEGRVRGARVVAARSGDDFIVGEMACMTHQPRSATLRAQGKATVLVIRRNMLHMLQRNRHARLILFPAYRAHALENYLHRGQLFAGLRPEQSQRCAEFLQKQTEGVDYLQVDPGQVVFRQGNPADSFYIVNLGHVQVSQTNASANEVVRSYLDRGQHFGEIGLMTRLFPAEFADLLPEAECGRRTATCTARDHVELVRIDEKAIRKLLDGEPDIAKHLRDTCRTLLMNDQKARDQETQRIARGAVGQPLGEFMEAGLYQGQNLLVLDLERCTRCQECVKACAASHGGVTRLILEGNRFGPYLVPSACRSCHDPVCLIGCPVDAIHRRPADRRRPGVQSLAIVIEDHCIGCGLCAHNCPFGSIHMHDAPVARGRPAQRIATNCDLCESLDGTPRCVYQCPHDAALRETGEQFWRRVERGRSS